MRLNIQPFLFSILMIVVVFGCKPSKQAVTNFRYFEQHLDTLNSVINQLHEPTIKANDLLSINVSSATLNQEQVQVFNLLNGSSQQGGGGVGAMQVFGYLVDYDGKITLPIIGKIQAAGLSKQQLTEALITALAPHVKNPVLTVRFLNFRVLLIGEVNSPGWQTFPNERATIVDAIGQAGGITDMGERSGILIIREQPDGSKKYQSLNINDARIFASPWFQLQQNDIVYVLPNESRLIQYQRSNSPFFRDLPVYLGLFSTILAFGTLIITILK